MTAPVKRRTAYRELPEGAQEFTASASLSAVAGASGLVTGGGQSAQVQLEAGYVGVVDAVYLVGVTVAGVPVLFFRVGLAANGGRNAAGFSSVAIPGTGSRESVSFDTDIDVPENEYVGIFYRNADAVAHVMAAELHGWYWPKVSD